MLGVTPAMEGEISDRAAWPRPMRQALLSVVGASALCLLGVSPAHAYVDAGTGSILLQAILGTVAVGSAVLTGLRGRIRALFTRSTSRAGRKTSPVSKAAPK